MSPQFKAAALFFLMSVFSLEIVFAGPSPADSCPPSARAGLHEPTPSHGQWEALQRIPVTQMETQTELSELTPPTRIKNSSKGSALLTLHPKTPAWFLAGAFVLMMGIGIGYLLGRRSARVNRWF